MHHYPDVESTSIRMPDHNESNQLTAYQVASQHWTHAEQLRWTLLYNFLMGSTILLLAWATVFTCSHPGRSVVLTMLAAAGIVLSLMWIALGKRCSGFVTEYSELGRRLESNGSIQLGLGAFEIAKQHRDKISGVATLAPSRFVLCFVPSLFAFLFLSLTILSVLIWCRVIV